MVGVEIFGVSIGLEIMIHAIAKLVAKARRVRVVVVGRAGLVSIPRIEGDRFIDIGIAIPDAISGDAIVWPRVCRIAVRVRKSIPRIKHGDTIDVASDRSETCAYFVGGDSRGPRDTVKNRTVARVIWKKIGFGGIEIPWAHQMGS